MFFQQVVSFLLTFMSSFPFFAAFSLGQIYLLFDNVMFKHFSSSIQWSLSGQASLSLPANTHTSLQLSHQTQYL